VAVEELSEDNSKTIEGMGEAPATGWRSGDCRRQIEGGRRLEAPQKGRRRSRVRDELTKHRRRDEREKVWLGLWEIREWELRE